MSEQAAEAVIVNPEALLRRDLDLLEEGCGILTTLDTGRLVVYSIQLEQAVEDLQSAARSFDWSRMEPRERQRCLLLATSLRRQVSQFDGLLNGWARYLTGWQEVRECREHGYTAAGAPSPAPASVRLRGEL